MSSSHYEITSPEAFARLIDASARIGAPQLPLFAAAGAGEIALAFINHPSVAWPTKLLDRCAARPTCVLISADPGAEFPDPPPPEEWQCARRLRYWAAGVIAHGAGGETDHYRAAVGDIIRWKRVALIECSSTRAPQWARFLRSPQTALITPTDGGVHPAPETKGRVH